MKTGVVISSDPTLLDTEMVYQYLQQSYWAKNIPREVVERSIQHSICFGVYKQQKQIGFARLVTDQATFAYLADVFVLPEHSGQGLGQRLIRHILDDQRFQGVRRLLLATKDAHTLYEKFGFAVFDEEERQKFMQIRPVVGY